MRIGNRQIGPGSPCYVIAEIGNNHNGDPQRAADLMRAFAAAGADAVKFQTFAPEDLVSPRVSTSRYPGWDVGGGFERWVDFLQTLVLPEAAYPGLIALARELKVDFISTATSVKAAQFLADLHVDALKVASMDANNLPLLRAIAAHGLPVIVSTGMATVAEIAESVSCFSPGQIALLHCVSTYPLAYHEANLRNVTMLREQFQVPIGFSDHSLGAELPLAALGLGAAILEKHVTFDRACPQKAEHHFAMLPDEFADMVASIRRVELAMGTVERTLSSQELASRVEYRRSWFFTRDMQAGEVVHEQDVKCLRPATSVAPRDIDRVLGRSTRRAIQAYDAFSLDDLG